MYPVTTSTSPTPSQPKRIQRVFWLQVAEFRAEFSKYKSDMFSTSRLSLSLVSRTLAINESPTGDDSEATNDPSHSLKSALVVLASDDVAPRRKTFRPFPLVYPTS